MTITIGAVSKVKLNFSENHGPNILRIFVTLPNFSFTTSATKCGYE